MGKPIIAVGALGGTICMSAGGESGGVKPAFSAKDLVSAVPVLNTLAELRAQTLFAVASGSLKIENLLHALQWAEEQVKAGAKGVVITQGTDSLEESAFFLNLLWKLPEPLVITGAMRNPDSIGAEGGANIYASVLTALDDKSRNRGVLAVLNDTVHSAKWVHKSNTFAVNTFISQNAGPEGMVLEGSVKYLREPAARQTFSYPDVALKVGICWSYLGDEGDFIEFAQTNGYHGLVVSAFGAGHVSKDMMDTIAKLAGKFPVIIASRTESGVTAHTTYGYYGSEITLQEHGAIMANWLSPVKARLLLMTLLANKMDRAQIKQVFDNY